MPVTVLRADITKLKAIDVIVSAANGLGITGKVGGGVAGAIRRAAGDGYAVHVREVAMKAGGVSPGKVYVTDSGLLEQNGVHVVLHAVTMAAPGGLTSYEVVSKCLREIFRVMKGMGFKSVAIPGLGTGIGNLDPSVVAYDTVRAAQEYGGDLDVFVVDIDRTFIEAAEKANA